MISFPSKSPVHQFCVYWKKWKKRLLKLLSALPDNICDRKTLKFQAIRCPAVMSLKTKASGHERQTIVTHVPKILIKAMP